MRNRNRSSGVAALTALPCIASGFAKRVAWANTNSRVGAGTRIVALASASVVCWHRHILFCPITTTISMECDSLRLSGGSEHHESKGQGDDVEFHANDHVLYTAVTRVIYYKTYLDNWLFHAGECECWDKLERSIDLLVERCVNCQSSKMFLLCYWRKKYLCWGEKISLSMVLLYCKEDCSGLNSMLNRTNFRGY